MDQQQEEWGLTERGFRRPTYSELLNAIEYKARELFGSKVNLTVRSPVGLFLRVFAWALNILFEIIEAVYNSAFIDTAVGTSLYNLGRSIGLKLLPQQKARGYLLVTGRPGVTVPRGWLAATVAGEQYVTMSDGIIDDDGTVLVPAQAANGGPDGNTDAGTITVIVNPGIPEGITAVTNPSAFTGGRERETDEEYRDRYYLSTDFAGGVNEDAIGAEILQNVEGVYSARVYESCSDVTDEHGLPPHSIEAVVYGGLDTDIAQAIYRRKAAGIQTYGNTSAQIIASNGELYTIYFTRPTPIPVWIRITDLKVADSRFPSDGIEQIKRALIDYIGSETGGGSAGSTVYYYQLPERIYSVPGVIDYVLATSADGVDYGDYNVAVGTRETAYTDDEHISITEVGSP